MHYQQFTVSVCMIHPIFHLQLLSSQLESPWTDYLQNVNDAAVSHLWRPVILNSFASIMSDLTTICFELTVKHL